MFLFRIDNQDLHVVVDLEVSGLDVRLWVFKGEMSDSAVTLLDSNDDNQEGGAAGNSRIRKELGDGKYIVRAELRDRSQSTSGKNFRLTVKSVYQVDHDSGDHQEDRTAAYQMGTVDAGLSELTQVTQDEAAKWDGIKMEGRDIEMCELSSCVNNDDGTVTTVQTGDGASCGLKSACAALGRTPANGHNHVTNSTITIEYPPIGLINFGKGDQRQVFVWTETASLHHKEMTGPLANGRYFKYLPAVMLHELGHTLGLDDLVGIDNSYLMQKAGKKKRVPGLDVEYIRQVYTKWTD